MVKKKEKELATEQTFNKWDSVQHKLLGIGKITDVRFNDLVVVQFKHKQKLLNTKYLTFIHKKHDADRKRKEADLSKTISKYYLLLNERANVTKTNKKLRTD